MIFAAGIHNFILFYNPHKNLWSSLSQLPSKLPVCSNELGFSQSLRAGRSSKSCVYSKAAVYNLGCAKVEPESAVRRLSQHYPPPTITLHESLRHTQREEHKFLCTMTEASVGIALLLALSSSSFVDPLE